MHKLFLFITGLLVSTHAFATQKVTEIDRRTAYLIDGIQKACPNEFAKAMAKGHFLNLSVTEDYESGQTRYIYTMTTGDLGSPIFSIPPTVFYQVTAVQTSQPDPIPVPDKPTTWVVKCGLVSFIGE